MKQSATVILGMALGLLAGPAWAGGIHGAFPEAATAFRLSPQVRLTQHLGEQLPLDARFLDERGRPVQLSSLLHGKPVILVFAYYHCPNLCTLVLSGLTEALKTLDSGPNPLRLGRDFDVLTVSIDPSEKPPLALARKRSFLARYGRIPLPVAAQLPDNLPWHFLTGTDPRDDSQIRRLAGAAGFGYAYDPAARQYAHPSGILVATPSGRISRYFYGIEFPAPALGQALQAAGQSRLGTFAQEILVFCFHYDPRASVAGPYVWLGIRLVSGVSLVVFLLLWLLLWRSLPAGPSPRRPLP